MNERYKELEKQCTKQQIDYDVGKMYDQVDHIKLAELIVRECDRYVAEQYDELEPWMQPGDLLKHFGVEE